MSCYAVEVATRLRESVAEFDIDVTQGSMRAIEWQVLSNGLPKNITGYTILAQIRKTPDAAAITATFSFELNDPVSGKFILSLTGTQTAALTAGPCPDHIDSTYHWDCFLISPSPQSVPTIFARGKVFVAARVSRLN